MSGNRTSAPNAGVGMASVTMIVLVLALTTFGILSLVSARADAGMSRKARENTAAYYAAEGRIQRQLADLDARILSGEEELPEEGSLLLREEVQEGRELVMELVKPQGDGRFAILRYGLVNTAEWNPDVNIEIWDGGI